MTVFTDKFKDHWNVATEAVLNEQPGKAAISKRSISHAMNKVIGNLHECGIDPSDALFSVFVEDECREIINNGSPVAKRIAQGLLGTHSETALLHSL